MSRKMNTRRLRDLGLAAGAAALTLAAAAGAHWLDSRQAWRPEAEGPVLPGWADAVADIAVLEIRTAQERILVRRTASGWVLPDRGDHPADLETLAALDAFMGALSYDRALTRDPDKHERLGLADPDTDGAAMRVTARNARGEPLADLLIGREEAERIFVRFPGTVQTWSALTPEIIPGRPDAGEIADWIELDFLALGEIARTRIEPESGPAYLLERASPTVRNFALRQPGGWTPITAGAASGPGGALRRLRLRDVRPAAELGSEPVARHEAESFSGLAVTLTVYADGEERWARIRADARADDARQDALALNARTENWAYLLSDLSVDRILRPIDGFAQRRVDPAETANQ